MSSLSSSSASHEVNSSINLSSATPGVEFSVVDSRFIEVGAAIGELSVRVPAGIYEVRERYGDSLDSYLITVRPDEPFRRRFNPVIPTVAPAHFGSSTSHEYQYTAAVEASRELGQQAGPPSGVVLMCRSLRGRETFVGRPSVSLRTLDGQAVPITDFWDSQRDYSITSGRLEPGVYVLRTARPSERPFEQAVVLCRDWQTLVFFPEGPNGPEPERASVHMCRIDQAWDAYEGRDHLVLEAALAGLADGRLDIGPDDLNTLLYGKFRDPMLGIVGAYALLQSRGTPRRFDLVVRNLLDLVPDHPDVRALRQLTVLASAPGEFSFAEPPMLLPSYQRSILPADLSGDSAIVDGSPLQRCAAAQAERGVWFTWDGTALGDFGWADGPPWAVPPLYDEGPQPGGLPGPRDGASGGGREEPAPPLGGGPGPVEERDEGLPDDWVWDIEHEHELGLESEYIHDPVPPPPAAVSPSLRRIQNYMDQVAAAEGVSREEALRQVTPAGVAAACGLPVQVVRRLMPSV